MPDDYRKPASPSASTPRGTPVRRADEPIARTPIATGADPRNKARFAKESALAAAELEAARRTGAITARVVGLGLLAFDVLITLLHRDDFVELGHVQLTTRGNVAMGTSLGLGVWMLVFGSGGAARMPDAPDWWRYGIALSALLGLGAFVSGVGTAWMDALLALTV